MATAHARHGPRDAGRADGGAACLPAGPGAGAGTPGAHVTQGSPELRRVPGEERLGRYFPYMLHSVLLVLAECAGDEDEARRHEAAARRIDPTRDPKRYLLPANPHHCQASLGHRSGRPE